MFFGLHFPKKYFAFKHNVRDSKLYIDQFRGPPIVWQEEQPEQEEQEEQPEKPAKSKRNRIVHDETTAPIVEWVASMNQWFQQDQGCSYKIMPYWSRRSVAFAMWCDETNKWRQAGTSF